MKNPYLYSYLPLLSILLYSLTFGIFAVSRAVELFQSIGLYAGLREFFTDMEIRVLLLFVIFLCFFMLFSALKLIGETIYETGMYFFSKDAEGKAVKAGRGGYAIFFIGGLVSTIAVQSLPMLLIIFALSLFCSFVYTIYKMSQYTSLPGMVGFIVFEVLFWAIFLAAVLFVCLKLYNGILASLPFVQ